MKPFFGFSPQGSVRDATTAPPEKSLSLPYELRSEMNWIDFSGTANPLGTPKRFITAMHAALVDGELSSTPDRSAHTLRSVLSKHYGLPAGSFLCSTSISDMIRSVAQTYRPTTVGVVSPAPAEYLLAAANAGHTAIGLQVPHEFVVPDAENAHELGHRFDAAVLANPTYPTSRLLSTATLKSYLDTCSWVIVDENLIELTLGGQSMVPLVEDYRNLIVVRSFSSTYAMPGVPVVYCVAHPDTIAQIERFFDNSGLTMFAEVVGAHILAESDYLERTREFLDTEIPWMQCMLNLIPGIHIFPAEANFVMCSYENSASMNLGVADTSELVLRLQLAGFLVRPLDAMPGITDGRYFSVAIRSREDNEQLIAALREIITCSPKAGGAG